jgi:class III poly(R)-hydroxyalkanoic acid synthase PhaE subunit
MAAWVESQRELLAGWPETARGLWETLQAGAGGGSGSPGAVPGFIPGMAPLPGLGLGREDQEAWQRLALLMTQVAAAESRLAGAWFEVHRRALAALGDEVAARAAAGTPVTTLRGLYDLWVECAERIHAESARSSPYVELQAELANSLSGLRIGQRELIERWARQYDLPTRAELDSVHRQLKALSADLRRVLRPKARAKPLPRARVRSATRARRPRRRP